MGRRICLSIAVANVKPPRNEAMRFAYLDGAIPAAEAIGQWAISSGFGDNNVEIVTDKDGDEVTENRVKDAVNTLLSARSDSVDHMVLSFCGHGLTDANAMSINWLFSDSIVNGYRVLANRFYSELQRLGIERITLFSDACRDAPDGLDLMRLDPRRVVVALQDKRADSPKFDKLVACQDGQLGYMVKSSQAMQPGKCIFSGVIADILWGQVPEAIQGGKIGIRSLAEFADKGTRKRAKDYTLELNPEILMHWSDVMLYDAANPPIGDPPLQPWPLPNGATAMGVTATETTAKKAKKVLHRLKKGRKPSQELFGGLANIQDVSPMLERGAMHRSMVKEVVVLHEAAAVASPVSAPQIRKRKRQRIEQLVVGAGNMKRKRNAEKLRRSVTQLKVTDDQHPDLVVMGKPVAIWGSSEVIAGTSTRARDNYLLPNVREGEPVLVEYGSGIFVPVVPYANSHVLVRPDADENPVVLYGASHSDTAFPTSLQWISRFVAGELRPSNIAAVAADLRYMKHTDPSVGAVCAYLYTSVADIDSIRRMAYFYASYGQPIPFDIVLLGEMAVNRENDGHLIVDIPEVSEKTISDDSELPRFITQSTPAATGLVGGHCPWLGLGWDHIGLVRKNAHDLTDTIREIAPDISRDGFTVFDNSTGPYLAASWGLSRTVRG